MFKRPYYPIIYLRGYAGTQGAVEETVADPYMGFNLGSTKIRQLHTRDIARFIFESPLVRLMKDEGYSDVYQGGAELPRSDRPDARSVWIYRYYEPVSKDLGKDFRPEIEDYARGLKELIDGIEEQYVMVDGQRDEAAAESFRVYLVAHSMGGLIARCLLQNISEGDKRVDKVFTYATPHGGIDLRWIGNVPDFLQVNNTENFSEKRMRGYLKLPPGSEVNSLDGKFDPERFFCLVGTNNRDYNLARLAVGPMSDGLVQIANASVQGAPRAFVHRAHSGHYGIVNSEEGYQNLRRFLFGNVRADAFLNVKEIALPSAVAREKEKGKKIEAAYHIEVVGRVRGARWDLHRRTVLEESAIFGGSAAELEHAARRIPVASTFLSNGARQGGRRGLGFSLDLRVQVPEYVVDGRWFRKDHYDGGYLFRDKINLEAVYDQAADDWVLRYGFDSKTPNRTSRKATREDLGNDRYRFSIPVEQKTKPGIVAVLEIETRLWNT